MLLSDKFWEMAEHFMEVVWTETGFPVVVFDEKGYIVRATDTSRIGDLHAGAEKILQGLVDEYAVSPEEAARNPLVREGYSCPIVIDGRRVAAFGITGKLDLAKPLSRVAAKMIHSWIEDIKHQEQLVRSERKYRSIFDHSAQGIFQTTLDGRLLTANAALAEMYAYPSPEALVAEMTDVARQVYVIPEDRKRLIDRLREKGRVTGFLTQYRRRDGQVIDVSINAHFVQDLETGGPLIEGIIENITARKQAEAALKKSEEKYFKAFNNSPVWVVLSSLETGRYIEVNETFVNAIGYSREEIIGRTALEIGSWVDLADRRKIQDTIRNKGYVRNLEVKRRTKDDRVLTMLFSAEIIDVAGEACMLSASQDISERKQAEEKLRLSENNLRITLNSIGDAVITTNTRGTVTRMNPMAEKLTGWTAAEAEGRPLPEVFRIVDVYTREQMENPAEKVMAEGKLVRLGNQTVLVARDGSEYRIAESGAPIQSTDSHVVGVVLVFRDVTEAHAQERKIREHEVLLKRITDNIPGAVYQFYAKPNHEYGLHFISERAADILGQDAAIETAFTNFSRGIPEDEQEGFFASIREAVETVNPWHYEGRFIKPTGETIWFSARSIPHRDGDDVVFDGVLMDISDVKAAQEEVRERRQFLELVLSHAPDAIVTMDADHSVIDWNPGAVQMFGYTPEEAICRQLDDLVAQGDAHQEASQKTRQVLSGSRVEAFETIRYRKDGSPLHVIAAGSPLMVDGVLKGVVAVYTDITARKEAEARLKESHERFLTVLQSIDANISVIDMETFEILYMNQTMKQVFGADLTGRTCWDVLAGGTQQCSLCNNDQLVDENGNPSNAVVWEYKNPVTHRWYVNHDQAIRWVDGRIVKLQVANDITRQKMIESERKDHEARIQRMQKMEAIGMLAGGIAHDFNNILSAVIGYADLALMDTVKESRAHSNIRQIHSAGMRARDLVQQILTFSRQDERELKPLQISSQVKEALKMLRSSLPTTIEISSHISTKVDNVMADATQIHQIVMNLCTNAAQAMETNGGQMTVRLSQVALTEEDVRLQPSLKSGDYAKLSIKDTGTGIPADILEKIYNPYFTTKEKGKGTGLGLAVVHGIVQSYGGDIHVESVLGRGTTFHVYLPTIKAVAEVSQEEAALPEGNERILFVDDEAFIVDFGRQGLGRLGYRVEGCSGSEEALERFLKTPDRFDLVITDMTMPKMTGDQLAVEILRHRPNIPIILCTGYSSRINSQQAEEMGIRAMLMKPINLSNLASNVRRVLDNPQSGE